jgi:hypothetical protein
MTGPLFSDDMESRRRQGYCAFTDGTPRENNPFPAGSMQHTQFQVGWDQACLLAGGPQKQPKAPWEQQADRGHS